MKKTVALLFLLIVMGLVVWYQQRIPNAGVQSIERTLAQRHGSYFSAAPPNPYLPPSVKEIPIPDFSSGNAIWGATGRDDSGHIWFGVTEGSDPHSATLFEYVPESEQVFNRGSVADQLSAADLLQSDNHQIKIHSKIIPADDGYLYFASMDEAGEIADGSQLPTNGSDLWRIKPGTQRWEHLFHAPEGLIAVNGVGRWIYALGYWDHVLYQYDTLSGDVRHIRVGSEGGHISRNFIVTENGHVFVPKVNYFSLSSSADNNSQEQRMLISSLVEYDTDLQKVASTPLIHYAKQGKKPGANHGIIGFAYLADGSAVFVTHLGYLYQILPSENGPAEIKELGWFHPQGNSYTPSLFTFAGERYLVGVGRRKQQFEWLVYDLQSGISKAVPFRFEGSKNKLLLYGSLTRDDEGRFYVAGRHFIDGRGGKPLLLQISVNE